jgi:tetratricopeptide (TPR) repeat protein
MSLLIKALKRAERKHDEAKLAAHQETHSDAEHPASLEIGLQAVDCEDTELALELARLQIDQNERSEGDLPNLPEMLDLAAPVGLPELQLDAAGLDMELPSIAESPHKRTEDPQPSAKADRAPKPALAIEGLAENRPTSFAGAATNAAANASANMPPHGHPAATAVFALTHETKTASTISRIIVYSSLIIAALVCIAWLAMDLLGYSVSRSRGTSPNANSNAIRSTAALPPSEQSASAQNAQPTLQASPTAQASTTAQALTTAQAVPAAQAQAAPQPQARPLPADRSTPQPKLPQASQATPSEANVSSPIDALKSATVASLPMSVSERRLAARAALDRVQVNESAAATRISPTLALVPDAAPGTPAGIKLSRSETFTEQTLKMNEQAWQLLSRNDRAGARSLYEQVLRLDRNNGDAWLGLATLAAKSGDAASADLHYRKALEIDPNDVAARAGLLSLRSNHEPNAQESRLRHLLEQGGAQPALLFALGNTLASQARWADAQQAYFSAYTADHGNGDYAFNLAVTLERLRQPQAAANHYRKALELAERRPAQFDRNVAERRLAALETRVTPIAEPVAATE